MGDIIVDRPELDGLGQYEFGWHDSDSAGASARRGINADVVRDISSRKNEPEWMLERRLKALDLFFTKPMPNWGADLSAIDFDNIKYFVKSTERQAQSWEDLPEDIRKTYERLGIPEAERQRLVAGVDLLQLGQLLVDFFQGFARKFIVLFSDYFAGVGINIHDVISIN